MIFRFVENRRTLQIPPVYRVGQGQAMLRTDLKANEITLKPQVLISLLTYQKYHSVRSTEYHFVFAPSENNCTNKRKEQALSLHIYLCEFIVGQGEPSP